MKSLNSGVSRIEELTAINPAGDPCFQNYSMPSFNLHSRSQSLLLHHPSGGSPVHQCVDLGSLNQIKLLAGVIGSETVFSFLSSECACEVLKTDLNCDAPKTGAKASETVKGEGRPSTLSSEWR